MCRLTNFNGAFTFSTLAAYEPNVAALETSCLSMLIATLPTVPTPDALATLRRQPVLDYHRAAALRSHHG